MGLFIKTKTDFVYKPLTRHPNYAILLTLKEEFILKIFDKEVQLLILDVDGVILNLVANFRTNLVAVANDFGLPIEAVDNYLGQITLGLTKGHPRFRDTLRAIWNIDEIDIRAFHEKFSKRELDFPYPLIPGSLETIQWFHEKGVLIAACTNNSLANLGVKFAAAGINPNLFSAFCTQEYGYYKPDLRMLLPIFSDLPNIPMKKMLSVGDWFPDLELAQKAGIDFVAVTSGGINRDVFLREGLREDHILERLIELVEHART